ncbi:hypothetical protein ACFSCX_06230 [Bacillus salitolerans]|uniref:Uncharacterized protein n=1 Tax=Bacillus salitolerans TaxID=1437434 RepID=A0ABW4LLX7_9BACI
MISALLSNGKVITSSEYNPDTHGHRLSCIDCKVPVVFVSATDLVKGHFKTTGKHESKHSTTCGFFKPLSFEESIQKIREYQDELLDKGIKEQVLKLNLSKLDPDYVPKVIERDETNTKPKEVDDSKVKVKQESDTPQSLSSLKSVVNLLSSYELDVLSTILVQVKGKKIPLSSIVLNQEQAHRLLWGSEQIDKMGYFVYGEIESVIRREKVIYVVFKPLNQIRFSLVVFEKYFSHFTYKDQELMGKRILAYGFLQKNTYKEKNTTEMSIKSNKYIEFLA